MRVFLQVCLLWHRNEVKVAGRITPRMDGIAATREIKKRWPNAYIVMLTTFDDIELIHAGLHAGALGYLLMEYFTDREREVLTMVATGASNREIAEALFSTEGTVKNHLSNILGKLGVRDRTQAALKAKELGLA